MSIHVDPPITSSPDLETFTASRLSRMDYDARSLMGTVSSLCTASSRIHTADQYDRLAAMFSLHAGILREQAGLMRDRHANG